MSFGDSRRLYLTWWRLILPILLALALSAGLGLGTTVHADDDDDDGGGSSNIVHVVNRVDGNFRARGVVQLNQIDSERVHPRNVAYAFSSGEGVQTLAIALQINLYEPDDAEVVAPRNFAIALNESCTGCVTVAIAKQYTIPVADVDDVPGSVWQLVNEMNAELHAVQVDQSITLAEAIERINAVGDRFEELAQFLQSSADVEQTD